MERAPLPSARTLPSIVLLVDEERDALDRYSRCLEEAGLWVAATTMSSEVLDAAEELKPDIIVADADPEPEVINAVVQALKRHASLGRVPIILLTSSGIDGQAADVVLTKPVTPAMLLHRTNELLGRTRQSHAKAADAMERAQALVERARATVERTAQLHALAGDRRRPCPQCSGLLEWVEQAAIGSVRYDYYRWCLKGCGLFCFDRDHDKWVKLA